MSEGKGKKLYVSEDPSRILKFLEEKGGFCELSSFPTRTRRLIHKLAEEGEVQKLSFKWKGRKRLHKMIKPEYAGKTFICSNREATIKLLSSVFKKPKSKGDAAAITSYLKALGLTSEERETVLPKATGFAARGDLLGRLSEIAKQKNRTLSSLVNELFEQTIKAEAVGVNLHQAVEAMNTIKAAREAGFILGFEPLWYAMAEIAYREAEDETCRMWFETGVSLAKRNLKVNSKDPLSGLIRDLNIFMMHAVEFNVQRTGNLVKFIIANPNFNESYSFLLSRPLQGALETLGYKIVESDISGFIRLVIQER